jgi:hypothetical protein
MLVKVGDSRGEKHTWTFEELSTNAEENLILNSLFFDGKLIKI